MPRCPSSIWGVQRMLQPRFVGGEERAADEEKADPKNIRFWSVVWTAYGYLLPLPFRPSPFGLVDGRARTDGRASVREGSLLLAAHTIPTSALALARVRSPHRSHGLPGSRSRTRRLYLDIASFHRLTELTRPSQAAMNNDARHPTSGPTPSRRPPATAARTCSSGRRPRYRPQSPGRPV